MRVNFALARLAVLVLTTACTTPGISAEVQPRPSAPPRFCEVKHSAWCLLTGADNYTDVPSLKAEYVSQWIVRGDLWRDHPLIINEPRGCRSGRSDTVALVSYERGVRWQGRNWNKLIVKLKKDGSCDLELWSAPVAVDPQAGAFFAGLSLVRPCKDAACEGDSIGTTIRPLVQP